MWQTRYRARWNRDWEMAFGHDRCRCLSISLPVRSGCVLWENVLPQSPAAALVFLAPQCDITWPSSLPPLACARRQWVLHGVILLASWARALSPSSQYLRGDGRGGRKRGLVLLLPAHCVSTRPGHHSFILTLFPSRFHYFALVKLECVVILWYHYRYIHQIKMWMCSSATL